MYIEQNSTSTEQLDYIYLIMPQVIQPIGHPGLQTSHQPNHVSVPFHLDSCLTLQTSLTQKDTLNKHQLK